MSRIRAALTFDDGPHPQTLDLLQVLEQYRIPATFFQCGMYVRRYPEIARQVARTHEIGNHTDTHPWLWRTFPAKIREEITRTQHSIEDATGIRPRVFRPPYGVSGIGLSSALRQHNLSKVMWTVIGQDWKLPAPKITDRVLTRMKPEGIICLHDGRDVNPDPDISQTIEAVRRIIPALLEQGYEFVTSTSIQSPPDQ